MPGLGKADENLSARHTIIKAALDAGMTVPAIAEGMKLNEKYTYRVKKKVESIPLVTVKRVKNALKSLDYFSNIENYKGDERIKPSDNLRASEQILSRSHPVIQQIETKSTNFVEFNLQLVSTAPQAIDITGIENPRKEEKLGLTAKEEKTILIPEEKEAVPGLKFTPIKTGT